MSVGRGYVMALLWNTRVPLLPETESRAMVKNNMSAPRSIIRGSRPRTFPFFAVLITDQSGREDLRIFKRRRQAELHFLTAATGILKGEKFFDVEQNLVPLQVSQMFGVYTDDRAIVRNCIDELSVPLIYCSIPGAGGDLSIDNLFRTVH